MKYFPKYTSINLLLLVLFLLLTLPAHAGWEQLTPAPTSNQLRAIWGTASNDIFGAGDYGTIFHYNGTSWSTMTSGIPQTIYGVWGSSGSNVFAVADSGKIIRYNGSTWSAMTSPTAIGYRDVWGSSSSNVFAVGENGIIRSYNGSTWSSMTSPTTLTLQGVWGSSATIMCLPLAGQVQAPAEITVLF